MITSFKNIKDREIINNIKFPNIITTKENEDNYSIKWFKGSRNRGLR